MPSRFLSEIPENNMEWLSKPVPRSDAWEDSRDDEMCIRDSKKGVRSVGRRTHGDDRLRREYII